MCDFDIASFRERSSKPRKKTKKGTKAPRNGNQFVDLLQKRLLADDKEESSSSESDSNDNKKPRKKKVKNGTYSLPKLSTLSDNDDLMKSMEEDSASESTDPQPKQEEERKGTTFMILSDDEDILPDRFVSSNLNTHLTTQNNSIYSYGNQHMNSSSAMPERSTNTSPIIISIPDSVARPDPTSIPALDIDDLDPELAKIAEGVPIATTSATNVESALESLDVNHSTSEPRKLTIKVQYICLNVPDDPNVQKVVAMLKKPVKILIKDNDRFDLLLTHYCKRKYMKKDDMVLVYQNVRVVLRATPLSLGMSPDVTNHMDVYKREDYEMKLLQDEAKKAEMIKKMTGTEFDEDLLQSTEPEEIENDEGDQQRDDGRIFIKLRGKDNEDITLRVKQTTTMQTIMKEYARIRQLEPEVAAKIRLSFEGETFSPDTAIQDTDLEDQDLISVLL